MDRQFTAEIQRAVQASSCSIEWLAGQLGKSAAQLYDELNPFPAPGRTAKLSLEDAVRLMELIKDTSPLSYINSHFHFTARHSDREPDGKDLADECLQGYQALAAFVEAVHKKADISEVIRLCCDAQEEIEDVARRYKLEHSRLREVSR